LPISDFRLPIGYYLLPIARCLLLIAYCQLLIFQMKVLHIISIDGIGGAEKLLLDLLPAILKQGIQAECLILHKPNNKDAIVTGNNLTSKGVTVFYQSYQKILDRSLSVAVMNLINAGNYDLIHSHLKYSDLLLSRLKRSSRLKLPLVTTVHGYRDDYHSRYGLQFRRKIFLSPYYWVTKYIYKKIDGFIFISEGVKDLIEAAGLLWEKPFTIAHNGYDTHRVKERNSGQTVLSAPRIALPGRLVGFKGHTYAIQAMKTILQTMPGATLQIYGQGPDENKLKEQTSNLGLNKQVFFSGHVNDLPQHLQTCDLALIPSIGEPFGIVFLDCFAAGLPVVAFDLPAGNEIIKDDFNGSLAKPLDTSDLSQKVIDLCKDPGQRERIITNAYAKLKEAFSIEGMAGKYISFYKTFTQ
jgi:glycosyltransferase involved in cell wall biosynthesis